MGDFGTLILAHLLGDFVFQTDWMAQNKSKGSLACAVHCAVYTACGIAVVAAQGAWWPFWTWVAIFATHFAIDRTGFAKGTLMGWFQQQSFRDNLGPWSGIIIDNTLHIATYSLVWVGVQA